MKLFKTIIVLVCCCCSWDALAKEVLPYRNSKLPVEQRVTDLLQRMTLEEKVGQLLCTLAWDDYVIQGKKVTVSDQFIKEQKEHHVGMLWATYRADPWTKKTLANGLNPFLAAEAGNALQKYVMEHTRLGIPLFLAEEAPHGHMAIGTTVFPTGIGLAASWSPELAEQVGQVIAKEIRLQGGHISYGPVMDLSRDPRWSRVEESLGEDPVLSGKIAAAEVKGLGAGKIDQPFSTLATLKHFIAYGIPEGGQNGRPSYIGQRELWDNFLPPFKRVIDAGALSVMTSYNSMDGVPCTSNRYLLTDILRQQWKFKGLVVSDLYSIDGIWETHHVASSRQEAGVKALKAGVDVDLGAMAFAQLVDAVNSGKVDQAAVDTACARVLRMKFQMGLFEHPYVDPKAAAKGVRTPAHVEVSRKAAQAAVTLLKNDSHLLPLRKDLRVAVVGPNADNRYNMLGDYTAPQEDRNIRTVLDGIRGKIPEAQVEYVKGCAIRDTTSNDIDKAVAAAHRADVIVAVVGGSSARDFKTSYQQTGAAVTDAHSVSDMECGEGYDRSSLRLLGLQNRLLKALKQTGKPLVVVYIEGRPLDKVWASEHADALLTAWYPGQEGGDAIADVLFGDYNPAGRLPITVPRSVGQLPLYYNQKRPAFHDYVEESAQPLYAFGYGLSYTRFSYSNLQVSDQGNHHYTVAFDVTNSGDRDGDEVPQLYLTHESASVVQPFIQLKDFQRIHIRKGETKHLTFTLTPDDLTITDLNMQRTVEAGDVTVKVGAASNDIRLKTRLKIK